MAFPNFAPHGGLSYFFPPPGGGYLFLVPLWRGSLTFVPLMEGVQGEGTTSGASRHLRQRRTDGRSAWGGYHLRRFTPPPPAEDRRKIRMGRKFSSVAEPVEAPFFISFMKGVTFFLSLMEGVPYFCPPHGGGAGGGFGLLGEQSLQQQPPPSLRDTSASGGQTEDPHGEEILFGRLACRSVLCPITYNP